MTREEADALRDQRTAEQPQLSWVVQQRGADDWVVMGLSGAGRPDPAAFRARRGALVDVGNDPRPVTFRLVPPFGGGE